MSNIRRATESDVPTMLDMAQAMHAESPRFRHLDFSQEKTTAFLHELIASPQAVALVAVREGKLVGMIGGCINEHFFGYDKVAYDFGLYVIPEYRGTILAVRFVHLFEEWAEVQGAKDVIFGISTEVKAEGVSKLLMTLGFDRSGYLMRKEINHV